MADRRLQVLHAVAKHLSFTKAAEALFMTQPAVTFQLPQLEEHFDTRLFDRAHRRISLTAAGVMAPEAMQVYQYAPEVDQLQVPVLVFVGEHEQYQRTRSILAGIDSPQKKKRDARVIVYPGVGRGFDFRAPEVRTFADELATQDSVLRAAAFIRAHLGAR